MRSLLRRALVAFSVFIVGGCGSSVTSMGGGSTGGQPPPTSVMGLFGQQVTFVADRATPSSVQPNVPNAPFAESDYMPLPQNKTYPVMFAVDGNTVTVTGDSAMVGTWDQQAGDTRHYNLTEGVFAGGRFDVWSGDTTINAELTIYGSGVPVISSERGTLVE